MNNNIQEIPRSPPARDWVTRIQINGILMKKPLGNQSNKWIKRFFVVKDGFLIYYDPSEKKEYDRRDYFNVHAKGIIPLGECEFKACREPQQPFCISLRSNDIEGQMALAADSEFERDKWMDILERSRRVTWRNTQLGDEMIRRLEDEGLQMARERQDYFDRLQSEVLALSEEKVRTEELERMNHELEKEKEKLETFTQEIQEEYAKIAEELKETSEVMQNVETERVKLSELLDEKRNHLETLDQDKLLKTQELQAALAEQAILSEENKSLSQRSAELQHDLQNIEAQKEEIESEKDQAELSLQDHVERLTHLEVEKQAISEHAYELESTINDLESQKEMTEKELKEEIKARLLAEQRLKDAEQSVVNIDTVVQSQSHNIEVEAQKTMTVNVKKLKVFFEDLAEEAKVTSANPIIMRNGMVARKTLARRAKTIRYNENRKRSSRNTMSCDLSEMNTGTPLRRTVSTISPGMRGYTPVSPRNGGCFDDVF